MTTDDNVTEIIDALARVSRAAKRAVLEEMRAVALNCAQAAAVDRDQAAEHRVLDGFRLDEEYHQGRHHAWAQMAILLTKRLDDAQGVIPLDSKAAVDA